MRILVVSDSHGQMFNLRQALLAQPKAEVVIHLGDGEYDLEALKNSYPDKTFLQVRGNCDWGSELPASATFTAGDKKIFYTHGHDYGVKSGLYTAVCAAREQKADILLYGHTHTAMTDYDDGLYIMNPGAISGYKPSYGTIDITEQGVLCNIVEM